MRWLVLGGKVLSLCRILGAVIEIVLDLGITRFPQSFHVIFIGLPTLEERNDNAGHLSKCKSFCPAFLGRKLPTLLLCFHQMGVISLYLNVLFHLAIFNLHIQFRIQTSLQLIINFLKELPILLCALAQIIRIRQGSPQYLIFKLALDFLKLRLDLLLQLIQCYLWDVIFELCCYLICKLRSFSCCILSFEDAITHCFPNWDFNLIIE